MKLKQDQKPCFLFYIISDDFSYGYFSVAVYVLYITIFKYDEAGNRIRKTVEKYEGGDPDPVHENTGDNQGWHTVSDEFYIRDASGKEIAIYSGTNLVQWNIWGLDNIGKINSDTTRNYYLKDHLGSIRVVLNSTNQVISAQDYDAWGYPLENRTYNATAMKYDFTGKERDLQTTYDYFGARYYDSRVANWTSIDPLFEKHYDYSPYNYVLRSPLILFDPDGMQNAAIKLTYPQEAIKETLSEINGKIKDVQTRVNNWIDDNKTITTIGKSIPYVGPAISLIQIIVSLPTPEIPVSQTAIEVIQEVTPITVLNSDDSGPSPNEIQGMIQKGQSPESIKRLDKGKPDKNEKPHLHFKKDKGKNHALNKDGTWKHGGRNLTNKEKKFLEKIGWEIPK